VLRQIQILWFLFCHSASTSEQPRPEPRVIVRVYDAVNLSSATLNEAEQQADEIFRFAGMRIVWVTGPLSGGNNGTQTETIRIWPRAAAGKIPTGPETLGFCLSLENGEAVVLANVIQKHAEFGPLNFANLLGITMAHELGHLLLRSEKHSVMGVMSAPFTDTALGAIARGRLRFTSQEGERMRGELKRRALESKR
jgi:hypothetical protein